jgi:two-component system response regulator ChvI
MKTNHTMAPALVDPPVGRAAPPHPLTNPCRGCPRAACSTQSSDLLIAYQTKRVYWKLHDVGLTAGQYRVVARLVEAAGEYVSYRAVYDVIQKPGFIAGYGDEGWRTNVRSFIKRVRRRFEMIDPTFDAIKNYQGFGYAFITGPVITMEVDGGKETARNDG